MSMPTPGARQSAPCRATLCAALWLGLLGCGKDPPPAPPPAPTPVEAKAEAPAPPAAAKSASPSSASEVDLVALGARPDDFKDMTYRCKLLLAPSPVALAGNEAAHAQSVGAGEIDDRRATFFCKTAEEGLKATPVLVWFPTGEKGSVLDVDRDTVAALRAHGSFGGQPVALFAGIVEGPRRPGPGKDKPDLLSALVWPDKLDGQTVRCKASMPALPAPLDEDDKALEAKLGGDLAPRKALLRCEDARGGAVSVALYVAKEKGPQLLQIGANTELDIVLHGFAQNQLIGKLVAIEKGALQAGGEGDALRSFLLDPTPLIGKSVPCRVLIAPTPLPASPGDASMRALLKAPAAAGHTRLACAAASGNVPVELFVPANRAAELLQISADSELKIELQGVDASRIVATLLAIERGAVPAPPSLDWRALALDPTPGIGKRVACEPMVRPFVGPRRGPAADHEPLFANDGPLAETMAVLNCKDHTGAPGGTRVEVYLRAGDAAVTAGLEAGKPVQLLVKGAGHGLVLALVAPAGGGK